MQKIRITGFALAASCIFAGCGNEKSLPKQKKPAKSADDNTRPAGEIDAEFIAAIKTLSTYDPDMEESARVIIEDFEKRYTSRDARRVLEAARRIWFPDERPGKVVRAGGFTRAGGHTFTWKKGEVSDADKRFLNSYARALNAPPEKQKDLGNSLPTEGVSEHLRSILECEQRTTQQAGTDSPSDIE